MLTVATESCMVARCDRRRDRSCDRLIAATVAWSISVSTAVRWIGRIHRSTHHHNTIRPSILV